MRLPGFLRRPVRGAGRGGGSDVEPEAEKTVSRKTLVVAGLGGASLAVGLLLLALWSGRGSIDPLATDGSPGTAPVLAISELNLPVLYDLEPALAALDRSVPKVFGDLTHRIPHPSLSGVHFAFEAERGPLRVELRGHTVRLTTELSYRARGWYGTPLGTTLTGGCPQGSAPPPRARIVLVAPLELGPDWNLKARPRIESVEPLHAGERDRCRVTPLQVDLTDWLMLTARSEIEDQLTAFDSALAAHDLPGEIERYWALLSGPVRLGEDTWLLLDPVAVRHGGFSRTDEGGDTLRLELAIAARPRIVLGPPPRVPVTSLPPLDEGFVAEHFQVTVEGNADYETLSELATARLRGRTFRVAGRSLEIRGVAATAAPDGRLAVELHVGGDVEGRLSLIGTPTYDPSLQSLTFPDLKVDVTEGSLLVRTAVWILQTAFPSRLRHQIHWPMEQLFEQGRELADGGLTHELSDDIRLEGAVHSLRVGEVFATGGGIVVRSILGGTARLVIDRGIAEEAGA